MWWVTHFQQACSPQCRQIWLFLQFGGLWLRFNVAFTSGSQLFLTTWSLFGKIQADVTKPVAEQPQQHLHCGTLASQPHWWLCLLSPSSSTPPLTSHCSGVRPWDAAAAVSWGNNCTAGWGSQGCLPELAQDLPFAARTLKLVLDWEVRLEIVWVWGFC